MKKLAACIATATVVLVCPGFGQVIIGGASGSQYTTSTWTNGSTNAFGGWFFSSGAGALNNISDSSQNGRASIGSQSFFILGGPSGSYFDVFAPLGGTLSDGQSVSLSVNYSWNGGFRGVEFENAFGAGGLFRFEHGGSDALRLVVDTTSTEIFANAYNQAFTYTVAYAGVSSVTVSASLFGISSPFFSTNLTLAAQPNQVKFYTGGYSGGTDQANYGLYFNDIATVPEPSILSLSLVAGLLLMILLRRLSRRHPRSP